MAVLAVIAAAIGVALLLAPGFSLPTTPTASYKYYVPGYATATQEPTSIGVQVPSALNIMISGDQRSLWATFMSIMHNNGNITLDEFAKDVAVGEFTITKQKTISAIQLRITLTDADLLKQYFNYLRLYIVEVETKKASGKLYVTGIITKAILTLDHPSEVITLDNTDFGKSNSVTLYIVPAYKVKNRAIFDQVPVDLKIQVLSVS